MEERLRPYRYVCRIGIDGQRNYKNGSLLKKDKNEGGTKVLDRRYKACTDIEKSEGRDWKYRKVWKLGCEKRH